MKNFIAVVFLSVLTFCFFSCNSKVQVEALNNGNANISFEVTFSKSFIDVANSVSGGGEIAFSNDNAKLLMKNAGFGNVSSVATTKNSINVKGTYNPKTSIFASSKMIEIQKNSLSVCIGPEQFKNLYELMDEEAKSYLDLLMIPCLIDEKMNEEEYKELVASMFGKTFANDLVNGTLTFTLISPNLKVKKTYTIKLAELFTLDEEKIYKINW